MGKAKRRGASRPGAIGIALLLLGTVAAVSVGAPPASATETPIYNAPPGGGPITTVVVKSGPYHLDALGGLHDEDNGLGVVPRPAGTFGIKSAKFDLVDQND